MDVKLEEAGSLKTINAMPLASSVGKTTLIEF
jgi:hypothetical protein